MTIPNWKQIAQDAANSRGPGYSDLAKRSPGPQVPAGSIIRDGYESLTRGAPAFSNAPRRATDVGGPRTALKAEGFSEQQINDAIGRKS